MTKKTIAMLHPGEMGAAVGACLVRAGHRVVWASSGRSASTRARAKAAGLEDLSTLARAVEEAEVVFSVCPPHGALDLATEVAELGFDGLYIDGNAISPDTAREVGASVEAAHAICDVIEAKLREAVENAQITIHVEPEGKAKHRGVLVL